MPLPAVTRLLLEPRWVRLPNAPPCGRSVNGSTEAFQATRDGSNPFARSNHLAESAGKTGHADPPPLSIGSWVVPIKMGEQTAGCRHDVKEA